MYIPALVSFFSFSGVPTPDFRDHEELQRQLGNPLSSGTVRPRCREETGNWKLDKKL
jgi:hypothetical protein